MSDDDLLKTYMAGFKDCGVRAPQSFDDPLAQKAYQLGWDHFILGDDVRAVDYLSNEEILQLIKG